MLLRNTKKGYMFSFCYTFQIFYLLQNATVSHVIFCKTLFSFFYSNKSSLFFLYSQKKKNINDKYFNWMHTKMKSDIYSVLKI